MDTYDKSTAPPAASIGATTDVNWQDAVADRMARRAAAWVISSPHFPHRNHLQPPLRPFGTFGHQPLFDYCAYAVWIWSAALELRAVARRARRDEWLKRSLLALTCTALAGLLGFVAGPALGVVLATAALPLVVYLLWVYDFKSTKNKVLQARISYVKALLNGVPPTNDWASALFNQVPAMSSYRLPAASHDLILAATRGYELFPGFGFHALSENIAARSDRNRSDDARDVAALTESMRKLLSDRLAGDRVAMGSVVRVAAATLDRSSPLLDMRSSGDRCLPFALEPGLVERRWGRRDGLLRVLCVCVYDDASGFLVSGFVTVEHGCGYVAASYDLCLLAPPPGEDDVIEQRLLAMQQAVGERDPKDYVPISMKDRETSKGTLESLRNAVATDVTYAKNLPEMLRSGKIETALGDSTGLIEYCRKLGDVTVKWPGAYYRSATFREDQAVDLPHDPFVKRHLLTLTHQVANALGTSVLETLETAGFDVSEYKKEGRFVVKADKIDQIFVGDKLVVNQTKVEKKDPAGSEQSKNSPAAVKTADEKSKAA